ncbi:MAG TPA: hypothetical protein ENK58_06295 [Desulfobacterales bacterium]|nr:hypothetical protein [Desulfobacterales bacterium]
MTRKVQEIPDLEALDNWYTEHFEELIEKYGGRSVAVVNGNIVAVAGTRREADQAARKSCPNVTPAVLSVPMEDELLCLL